MTRSFKYLHKISNEFVQLASAHWWDTMTCGQQRAYLDIHPESQLRLHCNENDNTDVSPLSVEQANKIQIDEIKKYHELKTKELGYDPGPAADFEWVKLHAKKFRDQLKEKGLSK